MRLAKIHAARSLLSWWSQSAMREKCSGKHSKEIEFASRKANKKWTKATETRQAAYCAAISQVRGLRNKSFFARFPKPANYLDATVQTVRVGLHELGTTDLSAPLCLSMALRKVFAARSRRLYVTTDHRR